MEHQMCPTNTRNLLSPQIPKICQLGLVIIPVLYFANLSPRVGISLAKNFMTSKRQREISLLDIIASEKKAFICQDVNSQGRGQNSRGFIFYHKQKRSGPTHEWVNSSTGSSQVWASPSPRC